MSEDIFPGSENVGLELETYPDNSLIKIESASIKEGKIYLDKITGNKNRYAPEQPFLVANGKDSFTYLKRHTLKLWGNKFPNRVEIKQLEFEADLDSSVLQDHAIAAVSRSERSSGPPARKRPTEVLWSQSSPPGAEPASLQSRRSSQEGTG